MMGQASAQRSVLTVNHASYYLDTTVPSEVQKGNRSVFQAGETYDIFLLYATPATKQNYSLYIGDNLSANDVMNVFKPGRMLVPDNSFPFNPDGGGRWATYDYKTDYDTTRGILTVHVDLEDQDDLKVEGRKDFCQPTTYCAWNSTAHTCGCLKGSGCTDDKVCSYATKDIDCPIEGCYGFQITLPDASHFKPGNGRQPPTPGLYTADAYFQKGNVTFTAANKGVAGGCFYSPAPIQNTIRNFLRSTSERSDPEERPNQ
jgi:hypothetical protein